MGLLRVISKPEYHIAYQSCDAPAAAPKRATQPFPAVTVRPCRYRGIGNGLRRWLGRGHGAWRDGSRPAGTGVVLSDQQPATGLRVAHLWFGASGNIASDRSCADYRAVQRGTVQHEVFEGSDAVAFQDGDEVIVNVNCRKDAGDILQPVRFGLAVTLEVAEGMLAPIPICEEVRERIPVRVQAAADAV